MSTVGHACYRTPSSRWKKGRSDDVPSPERRAQIAQDYRGMVDMFMATPPSFETIMTELAGMESPRSIPRNRRIAEVFARCVRHGREARSSAATKRLLPFARRTTLARTGGKEKKNDT